MKREIKFRVFVEYNKNIFEVREIDFANELIIIKKDDSLKQMFFRHCKLMQFTGLISPAGAEIYEGDLIAFNNSKIKLNVVFENGCFFLYHYKGLKEPDGEPYRWGALYRLFDADIRRGLTFEVIGNIHQNKNF